MTTDNSSSDDPTADDVVDGDEAVIDALTAAEIAPEELRPTLVFDDLDPDAEQRPSIDPEPEPVEDLLAEFLADDPVDLGPAAAAADPVGVDSIPAERGIDDDAEALPVGAGSATVGRRDDGSTRAGWAYLALLTVIAVAMIGWAVATSDTTEATAEATASTEVVEAGEPAVVDLVVNGAVVELQGTVPDQGAIDQLVTLAEARYGEGNVTSSLVIDPGVNLLGGVVNVLGSAEEGDDGPNGLQSDVSAALGLRAGGFDLTRTAAELLSVRVDAVVAAGMIELSGAFPDQASADLYVLAAQEIYGSENVTAFNVTVDPKTTLNGGLFGISGLVDAGDSRATEFEERVLAFFGGSRADTSGLQIDTSPEALARLEERLRQEVGNQPILFASGSADLDESSDAILTSIAASIIATPGVDVEIVGHTDGEGAVEVNQEISERRAQAVLQRLIELGVDEARLRARGAGESEPIADNDTEEGRAANRRIAFEFDGAG